MGLTRETQIFLLLAIFQLKNIRHGLNIDVHILKDFYVASLAILSFALQNCNICAIFPI